MKQRDLVKKLKRAGFQFERHGRSHDVMSEVLIQKKSLDIRK